VNSNWLVRLAVDAGHGFTRIDHLDADGEAQVTIGRSGQRGCAIVPARVFGELLVAAETAKIKEGQKPLTVYVANGAVYSEMGEGARVRNRTYLTEYINAIASDGPREHATVSYETQAIKCYVQRSAITQDPGKPALHPVCSPFLPRLAYAPNATKENAQQAIEERVEKFQKRKTIQQRVSLT
jgi:hypothetical protein